MKVYSENRKTFVAVAKWLEKVHEDEKLNFEHLFLPFERCRL